MSALRSLGFIPEEIEDFGFRFEFEGFPFLYTSDTDEEETRCITFIVPAIHQVTEENRGKTLEALLKLCYHMKFVQPNIIFDEQVCLTYQHYAGDNPVTEDLIEHIIRVLIASTSKFFTLLDPIQQDNDN